MTSRKLPRGVFQRDGLFWICYADQNGKFHREKVGPFIKQAQSAYQKRKSEVREGKFFPEKVRQRPILFSEVAQDFLDCSKKFKRSHGHDMGCMETLFRLWRDRQPSNWLPAELRKTSQNALNKENGCQPPTIDSAPCCRRCFPSVFAIGR